MATSGRPWGPIKERPARSLRIAGILEERKRRELDPTLTTLHVEGEKDRKTSPKVKKRIADILAILEQLTGWYDQMIVDRATVSKLMKLGARVQPLTGR